MGPVHHDAVVHSDSMACLQAIEGEDTREPFDLPYHEPALVIEWQRHTCSFLLDIKRELDCEVCIEGKMTQFRNWWACWEYPGLCALWPSWSYSAYCNRWFSICFGVLMIFQDSLRYISWNIRVILIEQMKTFWLILPHMGLWIYDFESFTLKKPNVSKMHSFRSVCYNHVQNKKKLDARGEKGLFVGYARGSPAYLVNFPETGQVKHVRCEIYT